MAGELRVAKRVMAVHQPLPLALLTRVNRADTHARDLDGLCPLASVLIAIMTSAIAGSIEMFGKIH
jgi:hypothetical protein